MRARLETMVQNQEFTCICDAKVADKIDRVVTFACGVVKSREKVGADTVICVMKCE